VGVGDDARFFERMQVPNLKKGYYPPNDIYQKLG
jgi:hypothetical protein